MAQQQIIDGQPDGAVMGRSDDKIGFFGLATSIVQETSASFTSTLAATTTTTATTTALQADLDALRTRYNRLMVAISDSGYNLIASS
jgi:hypothetical protein